MTVVNYHVKAGFAAARLRGDLVGLQVNAIVGYTKAAEFISVGLDKAPDPVYIPHWRTGIVQQFQPDDLCKEIVLQFQWQDENGKADIGICDDEDITLLLLPDQLHLLDRFK